MADSKITDESLQRAFMEGFKEAQAHRGEEVMYSVVFTYGGVDLNRRVYLELTYVVTDVQEHLKQGVGASVKIDVISVEDYRLEDSHSDTDDDSEIVDAEVLEEGNDD